MGSFLMVAGGLGGTRGGESVDVATTLLIDGKVFPRFGELGGHLSCGTAGGGGIDAGVLRLGTTALGAMGGESAVEGRR